MSFPLDPAGLPDFPVRASLDRIRASLAAEGVLILGAATGAGKSTLVPPALLGQAWLGNKRIVVLQPQRLGTWAIAQRIGELCGLGFGPDLGTLTSRGSQGSPRARLQVMTSGVFLRIIQQDPELSDIGCVIFDEFHQRSWQSDLSLSFCLECREAFRPDLRLVVMSATLDAQALHQLIPRAGQLDVPGRLFPVRTEHSPPPPEAGWWKSPAAFMDFVARQILARAHGLAVSGGNILCFLPGMAEIRRVRRQLEAAGLPPGCCIHELHSTTPDEAQGRALAAPEQGQIFLSSNIAETGLTLRGVTLVIDSGLTRLEFFDPRLGMNSLETCRVSLDSSLQRQGRAGRTGPGHCLKLWPVDEVLETRRLPDIQRSDLSPMVLEGAIWGIRQVADLHLVDLPARSLWNRAVTDLQDLGMLQTPADPVPASCSGNGHLPLTQPAVTASRVAGLGFHPRLGQAIQRALGLGEGPAAFMIALASFLEYRSRHASPAARPAGGQTSRPAESGSAQVLGGANILPALDQFFARPGTSEVHEQYARAIRRISHPGQAPAGQTTRQLPRLPPSSSSFDCSDLCQGIHPEWTGLLQQREADRAVYQLAQGRTAVLKVPAEHPAPQWLAGLEIETGERMSTIRLYAPLSEAWVRQMQAACPVRTGVAWQGLVFRGSLKKSLGAILLSETPASTRQNDQQGRQFAQAARDSFRQRLATDGPGLLPWTDSSSQHYLRLGLALERGLVSLPGSPLPAGSGGQSGAAAGDALVFPGYPFAGLNACLVQQLPDWIQVRPGEPVLDSQELAAFLAALLDRREQERLEALAPASFALPGRRPRPVDYSGVERGQAPAVSLRIQDAFGIRVHPLILGVPVLFHLLSPASRPVQSTSDLPGFWQGSWQEVRKDLKGRYPKHDWPVDPGKAAGG